MSAGDGPLNRRPRRGRTRETWIGGGKHVGLYVSSFEVDMIDELARRFRTSRSDAIVRACALMLEIAKKLDA